MNQNTSTKKIIKRVVKSVVAIKPKLKPRLRPFKGIDGKHKGNTGCWVSTSEDPQFRCEFPVFQVHTGWYAISLLIDGPLPYEIAKMYIDYGDGFIEEDAVSIPYSSGVIAKRFVKISRSARAFRFDPQAIPGEFRISEFSIAPVAFKFAESRMLRKLTRWEARRFDEDINGMRQLLKEQAKSKGIAYEKVVESHYKRLFATVAESGNYSHWMDTIEIMSQPLENQVASLLSGNSHPLISVVMPTYNSDPEHLTAAVESLLSQSYPHWQLCISDDGSDQQCSIDALQKIALLDSRIEVHYQNRQAGIAENTNAALNQCKGEYCTFLDHDDLLANHALLEVAACIKGQPDLKLIYSDEDKLGLDGERRDPHFKPDWNPDLLLAQNYICHLLVIRRETIEQAGLCRAGYEGAQDHDLILRVAATLADNEVHHIQKVLYHWRMTAQSTAANAGAKDYSSNSGVAAVADYVKSVDASASVVAGKYPNTYQVKWSLPHPAPMASIIIPTRDQAEVLSRCVDSLLTATDYPNFEILLVDNQSEEAATHAYFDKLKKNSNVHVLSYDQPFNYSAINNYAVSKAQGSVVVLLNNDTEVISPEWLHEMVSQAIRPEIGCVGAKLLYTNNMVQHAGVILGIGGVAGHSHKYFDSEAAGYHSRLHLTQNMSAVTAACLAIEKRLFVEAGGLNDVDLKIAFNDVDFCLKVRSMGLRNLWTPYAMLYHHESISRGHEDTREKQMRFAQESVFMQQQWGDSLLADPAYNPNLTRNREDFSLAA